MPSTAANSNVVAVAKLNIGLNNVTVSQFTGVVRAAFKIAVATQFSVSPEAVNITGVRQIGRRILQAGSGSNSPQLEVLMDIITTPAAASTIVAAVQQDQAGSAQGIFTQFATLAPAAAATMTVQIASAGVVVIVPSPTPSPTPQPSLQWWYFALTAFGSAVLAIVVVVVAHSAWQRFKKSSGLAVAPSSTEVETPAEAAHPAPTEKVDVGTSCEDDATVAPNKPEAVDVGQPGLPASVSEEDKEERPALVPAVEAADDDDELFPHHEPLHVVARRELQLAEEHQDSAPAFELPSISAAAANATGSQRFTLPSIHSPKPDVAAGSFATSLFEGDGAGGGSPGNNHSEVTVHRPTSPASSAGQLTRESAAEMEAFLAVAALPGVVHDDYHASPPSASPLPLPPNELERPHSATGGRRGSTIIPKEPHAKGPTVLPPIQGAGQRKRPALGYDVIEIFDEPTVDEVPVFDDRAGRLDLHAPFSHASDPARVSAAESDHAETFIRHAFVAGVKPAWYMDDGAGGIATADDNEVTHVSIPVNPASRPSNPMHLPMSMEPLDVASSRQTTAVSAAVDAIMDDLRVESAITSATHTAPTADEASLTRASHSLYDPHYDAASTADRLPNEWLEDVDERPSAAAVKVKDPLQTKIARALHASPYLEPIRRASTRPLRARGPSPVHASDASTGRRSRVATDASLAEVGHRPPAVEAVLIGGGVGAPMKPRSHFVGGLPKLVAPGNRSGR